MPFPGDAGGRCRAQSAFHVVSADSWITRVPAARASDGVDYDFHTNSLATRAAGLQHAVHLGVLEHDYVPGREALWATQQGSCMRRQDAPLRGISDTSFWRDTFEGSGP